MFWRFTHCKSYILICHGLYVINATKLYSMQDCLHVPVGIRHRGNREKRRSIPTLCSGRLYPLVPLLKFWCYACRKFRHHLPLCTCTFINPTYSIKVKHVVVRAAIHSRVPLTCHSHSWGHCTVRLQQTTKRESPNSDSKVRLPRPCLAITVYTTLCLEKCVMKHCEECFHHCFGSRGAANWHSFSPRQYFAREHYGILSSSRWTHYVCDRSIRRKRHDKFDNSPCMHRMAQHLTRWHAFKQIAQTLCHTWRTQRAACAQTESLRSTRRSAGSTTTSTCFPHPSYGMHAWPTTLAAWAHDNLSACQFPVWIGHCTPFTSRGFTADRKYHRMCVKHSPIDWETAVGGGNKHISQPGRNIFKFMIKHLTPWQERARIYFFSAP